MFTCVLGRYADSSLNSTETASMDSYAEIKSAASVAFPVLAELGGRCRKAMLGVYSRPTQETAMQQSIHRQHSSPWRRIRMN